MFKKNF